MGLDEYIFVFFKEVNELVPKASRQLRSYLDYVLRVLVIQFDGFQLLDGTAFLLFFLLLSSPKCMRDVVWGGWDFHIL